ncbi:MAG: hypothetical protein AAF502_25370 [Bacteroidota bacterium]
MRRKVKPIPIIILLLVIGSVALYFFAIKPNQASIEEFFREKEIVFTENTTFTIYDSPYQFNQHLIIESGVQLTIEPGVEIFMGPNSSITVYGQLQARGSAQNPITIAGDISEPGHWAGITFTSFCGMENTYERAYPVLKHCIIKDAKSAIISEGCPIDILNCHFENHERAVEINQSSNARVRNSFFLNCKEGLKVHQEVPVINLDIPEVTGNEFEQCQSILIEGTVEFGHNFVHNSGSEYGAITIAPPDSHKVIFHHNRLKNHARALDISSLRDVSVEITKNCFDNNGTHLYKECNNSGKSVLKINENNFLRARQFKVKAIEGCTETEGEKIDLNNNYWGTSDKNKILESIWNYSSSSSIRISNYRFIAFPCQWQQRAANSVDANLVEEIKEDINENVNDLETKLAEINEDLKNKLDSIKQGFNTKIEFPESTLDSTSITINGLLADTLFKSVNKKLADGKSIEITVGENGQLITREIDNSTGEPEPAKPEDANCPTVNVPDNALFTSSFWIDKEEESKNIFLCSFGSYFTYYRQKRIIYVSKNASTYLMNTGGHTVYVEAGGRLRVNLTSTKNTIYHHPDAVIQGELGPENVSKIVECSSLELTSRYGSLNCKD